MRPRRFDYACTEVTDRFTWLLLSLLVVVACVGGSGAALRIQAPPVDHDAEVYVDGNYIGTVAALHDPELGTVQLAPGVHRVEIRKAGRFPVQRTVKVKRPVPTEVVVEAELIPDPP